MDVLHVAIVEDSDPDRVALETAVRSFVDETGGIALDVRCFADPITALAELPSAPCDILFLDIEMPGIDGLEAARTIRRHDTDVIIFFVTNMVQYALEGYTVDAAAFILKPLKYPVFSRHMRRALEKLRSRDALLATIPYGREGRVVNVRNIAYAETSGKRSAVHVTGISGENEIPCSLSLAGLEDLLGAGFYRIHTSFLVNIDHVQTVRGGDAIVGDAVLPISKYRRQGFLKALANGKARSL